MTMPLDGIRVRCSRCKCAFFVESPQRLDAERANDLALDALAPDPPVAPPEVADPTPANLGLEDDESDWQFKEDVAPQPEPAPAANDLAAAREAVDDLLGSSFSESLDDVAGSENSFDLGASDLNIDPPEPALEESASELEPDPDLDLEPDEDPNAVTLDHGVTPGALPDAIPIDVDPDPVSSADAAEACGDPLADLASPEDWDSFADAEVSASSAGAPAALAPAVESVPERAADCAPPECRDSADLLHDPDIDATAGAAWIARTRSGIGWALVGLLCAYAAAVGLGSKLWPSQAAERGGSIAGFEVLSIKGRWVENAVSGPIYVVSGELHARASEPLPAGSLLRIRLLDAAGAPIAVESAAVGPPIPSHRVREWNLRDLRDAQEAGALGMARRPVVPGQPRLFVAVLGALPGTAAAYEFQVVAAASPAASAAERAYPVDGFAAERTIE